MKKLFITLFGIISFVNLTAQNPNIAKQSLEFINKKLHFNLEKENELILVKLKKEIYIETYISFQFVTVEYLHDLTKFRKVYELKKISNHKYEFTLRTASLLMGSFTAIELNGKCMILDFQYTESVQ